MTRTRRTGRGFTLIELLVTIALASVLMMIAVPSFVGFQRSAELTASANTLLAAMNAARGESLKRAMNSFVVPLTNNGWASGWRVFVDTDRSNSFTSADILVTTSEPLKPYFSITGSGIASGSSPYVMFNGSGYASSTGGGPGNLSLVIRRNDLSGSSQLAQTRRIMVAATGRVRVCKPVSTTDPDCGG